MDGFNIYTKAHVTNESDQIGRIYIGQEKLKIRRVGHNATLEQDAVHIGCEADLAIGRAGQTTLREGTTCHRSCGQCHADKHLDQHGL